MREEICQICGKKLILSKLGYYCPSCHTTINLNDIKLNDCEEDDEWVDKWFTSGLVSFESDEVHFESENDENWATVTTTWATTDVMGIGDNEWLYVYDKDIKTLDRHIGEPSQIKDHCLKCGHPLSVSKYGTIYCQHCNLQGEIKHLKSMITKMSRGNAEKPYWKLDLFWDEEDKDYNFCIRTSQYGIIYHKPITKEKLIEIVNKHNESLDRMYDVQNHLFIGDENNDIKE